MRQLSDKALTRLREGAEPPDLSGTRYRLLGRVARGGMGVVYAAEDQHLQRRVALKVLDLLCSERELANRLMREARVLALLEHPGIVPVHDVGTLADGRVFYAMKFVDGQPLGKYIESLASTSDRLRTFLRACEAVGFAHSRGVLHRDLRSAGDGNDHRHDAHRPVRSAVHAYRPSAQREWQLRQLRSSHRGYHKVRQDSCHSGSYSARQAEIGRLPASGFWREIAISLTDGSMSVNAC